MALSKTMEAWDLHLKSLSKSTTKTYRRSLRYFMERWGYTEESLYETRLEHLENSDRRDQLLIPNQVKVQMKELIESGKSGSTARQIYKAVKSFFESQNLDFTIKAKDKPKKFHNGSRVILKQQIKSLLEHVGNEFKERNQAIIVMLKDSGLRVGDLSNMNVGHYRGAVMRQDDQGDRYAVFEEYTTEKTGAPAFIHLGPESVEALDSYLAARERNGESLASDTPLFVGRQGRMTSGSLTKMIIRLSTFIGDDGRKITANSMRKFFQTSLEARGMNQNFIGKYNGRQAAGSAKFYSQPEDVSGLLFETYVENYDGLRISEEGDVREINERFAKIERAKDQEIKTLETRVSYLESRIRKEEEENPRLEKQVRDNKKGLATLANTMDRVEEMLKSIIDRQRPS